MTQLNFFTLCTYAIIEHPIGSSDIAASAIRGRIVVGLDVKQMYQSANNRNGNFVGSTYVTRNYGNLL